MDRQQEKEVDGLLSWGFELRQKNMGFPSMVGMIERKEIFHETGMEQIPLGSHCSLRSAIERQIILATRSVTITPLTGVYCCICTFELVFSSFLHSGIRDSIRKRKEESAKINHVR